jgi:hypothetical protein
LYCRDTSLVKHLTNSMVIKPLKCRCWHCERCAEDRQKDLRGLARRGEPNMFLTLTVNPALFSSPQERAERLRHAWLLLRIRIKKRFNYKTLPFLAVFEKTKNGEPHLHILMRSKYIPRQWISDQMLDLMGAPIVDVRRIFEQGRVAAYVAKYIGKDPTKWDKCKRYWRSQDYELEARKYVKAEGLDDEWWEVRNSRPELIVKLCELEGMSVTKRDRDWLVFKQGHDLLW